MTSVTWGNGESLFFLFVQLEILSAGVFDGMTIVQLKKGREKMGEKGEKKKRILLEID